MNIEMRCGITTGDDKGKHPKEDGWVRKAREKEAGFDLACTKENFMESNKVPETSAPIEVDPSVLTMFLETCMKLLRDSKAVKGV